MDDTDPTRQDAQVRASELRFRSLVQHLPNIAVQGYDQARRVIFWNAASEAVYGYSAEEALGRQLEDLIIPAPMREGVIAAVTDWLERGVPIPAGELVLRRKDGSPVPVFSSHVMLENSRGEREMHCIDIDLTERKAAEAAHLESEGRFRAVLEQNVAAIYVVEHGVITFANRRAAEILGFDERELPGRAMLDLVVEEDRPAMIEGLAELVSGGRRSSERTFRARRRDGKVVDLEGNALLASVNGRQVVLGIVQDVSERKRAQAEIARYVTRLERSVQSTLEAVSHMVELRDPYTSGHQKRVGELAAAIGTELGLPGHDVKGLRLIGYVHDIGKISAPAELLTKPTRLTETEFELIKTHSQAGHDVLAGVDFPWPVAEAILQHHERLDGSGYPRGLTGEQILLEARIVAVADVVEAMASFRPYRPAKGIEAPLAEIAQQRGVLYDARVVDACLRLFRERGYRFDA